MTVFEDLIGELKKENLLEDTVLDVRPANQTGQRNDFDELSDLEYSFDDTTISTKQFTNGRSTSAGSSPDNTLPYIEKTVDDRDFYRKRAVEEVSSLQMVEHVLSGVEREHMKTSPVAFDDLEAKKALHKFLQFSADPKSREHAEADFALRQETERWSCALYDRDKKISVANVRRFIENSNPVLSSQALMSLARFYRNSPYSEEVRGKFDFIMTRLFSHDSGEEKRRLLFQRAEMVGHISTLYANWSSFSMYSTEEDQSEISLAVTRFEDLIIQAEISDTFDELLEANFFNKVRRFKEESAELFYVPQVAAAAIESNLKIGNKYVDLIAKEKTAAAITTIEEKYGYTHDQIISTAAARTLSLINLVRQRPQEPDLEEEKVLLPPVRPVTDRPVFTFSERRQKPDSKYELFGSNKWLLAVLIVALIGSISVYLWSENFAGGEAVSTVAVSVKIDDPEVSKNLRNLRSDNETLYAETQPAFDALDEEQKRQFIQRLFALASAQRMTKVNLLNAKGRTVAFASKDRLQILPL